MDMVKWLGVILELTKAKITIAVTLSVATGHFLFTERLSQEVLLPMSGVFFLACGSSVLNQIQEAAIDRKMSRTKNRPIPSGRIKPEWAGFVSLVLIGTGIYLISLVEKHTVILLGLAGFAVFWYNVVYVLLKRITAFAVVPGALVGAIPPVIGWVSGGGWISDEAIVKVALFFFIWQIPHFWLLCLIFGRDYEEAGLPSLTSIFSKVQITRITCMWMLAVSITGLFLALARGMHLPWNLGVLIASLWLASHAVGFLKRGRGAGYFPAFMRINFYAFLMMLFLSGDAFW